MSAVDRFSPESATLVELAATIASLLEQGADSFDPIRFRYIESMVKRAGEQRKLVAQIIEKKVRKALNDYQHDAMNREASVKKQEVELNDAREELIVLTQHLDQGKSHDEECLNDGSFANVLRQQESDVVQSVAGTATGQRREPNAIRLYRESWIKQNSDRLVVQSVKNGPEDPGPLNSQMLVIHSLSTMRGLSPDYLNRFVSYVDTLLWLEQVSNDMQSTKPKKGSAKSKGAGKNSARTKK
ncbi:hypothetical protein A9Q81_05300 [Gammaproteobacteria bacterium 42_54_T18]|nr:hypothetical protein A9Q81_05300 [Gammaproteobacteria bacterium 42_54_T18]